jgi:hypothetical protein
MCTSLIDYRMTYTFTETISEKYKIEDSVTVYKKDEALDNHNRIHLYKPAFPLCIITLTLEG